MADDVLITPASRKIEFFDTSNNIDAKIETDASGNLSITNPGGDISIGDTTADVYIGDGVNNIDIVFEQNGEIRGLTGVTVTLGQSDSFVNLASTSLTTNQTTFNLINTTATTLNFAGASTALTIGATTGTTTVRNALNVSGDLRKGNVNLISVQDSAPTGVAGNLWYESDSGTLNIYYGGAWVEVNPNLGTTANAQFNSLGVGTAASTTTGEIRATNEVTAYYSDERLKDFEGIIDNALDKIKQLNGYYFRENKIAKELGYNNDNRQVGVSAQEVKAVLPEIVTEAPISNEYLTVKYEKMIPLLIEAIKEQQIMIDEMQREIDSLKNE